MIHVIALITAKPGQRALVLREFQSNAPAVRAEIGCIEYVATVDSSPGLKFQTDVGADTFAVIEKWDSAEALIAHSTAPHMVAYGAKTKDFVASRVIHVLSPA